MEIMVEVWLLVYITTGRSYICIYDLEFLVDAEYMTCSYLLVM